MNKTSLSSVIGFSVIGILFCLSLVHVVFRKQEKLGSDKITIRFSHWSLESGVREAMDDIAREYMRLHPNVQVIQQPVPSKVYPNWLITQLIGETAPDLVLIGKTMTQERIARYFVPITSYVRQPNPYNQGTELEGIPWADTFNDGLEGAYEHTLQEYYGVPYGIHVIRVFYNRDLIRKICGIDHPPQDYEGFMQVCRQIQEYSQKTGDTIVPIAGSKFNAIEILPRFFSNQTQKLIYHPSALYSLTCDWANLAPAYWKGQWSLNTPEIRSGLEIMREIGQKMPPGFQQLEREDATMSFVQQRSVMIASGTWDQNSLKHETAGIFEMGVCPIPIPIPSKTGLGQHVLGPVSEADNKGSSRLVIPRCSPHFKTALDFQQFLTSQKGNQIFVQKSGWLPIIAGVPIPAELNAFKPQLDGYPKEFRLDWPGIGLSETTRLIESELSQLFRNSSSVESFISFIQPRYLQAVVNDYRTNIQNQRQSFLRAETVLVAQSKILDSQPTNVTQRQKILTTRELLQDGELTSARNKYCLFEAGYSLKR